MTLFGHFEPLIFRAPEAQLAVCRVLLPCFPPPGGGFLDLGGVGRAHFVHLYCTQYFCLVERHLKCIKLDFGGCGADSVAVRMRPNFGSEFPKMVGLAI